MCGLAGIVGNGICDLDLKVLEEMSRVLVVRGRDGSGIMQASAYNKGFVYNFQTDKSPAEIGDFIWYHGRGKGGNKDLFNGRNENFFAVHVRAATKGAINRANAHPFEFDEIIGMHNGTLYDHKYQPPIGGGTDSEMMFADMAKRGIKPVLAELSKNSAYAIVVFNKKTGEITLARNKERPLFCAYHAHRKVFYWASEAGLLDWILSRNGIPHDKIYYISTDNIHTFGPWDVRANSHPNWRVEVVKEEVKAPTASGTFLADQIAEVKKTKQEKKEEKKPTLSLVQGGKQEKKTPLTEASDGGKTVYPRSRLRSTCLDCGRELDLLAQYQGFEISAGNYICKECDDLRDAHWVQQNNPVIH